MTFLYITSYQRLLSYCIAFTCAPLYAWLNMRSIRTLDEADQPPLWLSRLAIVGFIYLLGFSLLFVVLQMVG